MRKCFFFVLLLISCQKVDNLKYDDNLNTYKFRPNESELEGKVVLKTISNYLSGNEGQIYWLILSKPIIIIGNKNDELNSKTFTNIYEMQIAPSGRFDDFKKKYLYKSVKIKGQLFTGHSAFHHSVVLLSVTNY